VAVLVIKVAAVFMLVLGLSYILQARMWLRFSKTAEREPDRLIPLGLLIVVFGAAIVGAYSDWSIGWGLPVTALGWILLLKGVSFLVFPKVATLGASLDDSVFIAVIRIGGSVIAVVGFFLVYKAWFSA